MRYAIVVPWHDEQQRASFLQAWGVPEGTLPDWLFLTQDADKQGCARTKNRGIKRAIEAGAEYIVVLDDDCYPCDRLTGLPQLASWHIANLEPKPVEIFTAVCEPPSRGTVYFGRSLLMPVAASMGFWTGRPDFDSLHELVLRKLDFYYTPQTIFQRYFPLCGMNLAFRASEWPWCAFVNVPRFDDIWSGFLWQRRAYAEGRCFYVGEPEVRHVRQSNTWRNLQIEAQNLERNEQIWRDIATMPLDSHAAMLAQLGLSL